MIRNSYIFLPKIKYKKEQNIWNQDIKNWNDFLSNNIKGISKKSKAFYDRKINEAKEALRNNNSAYFYNKLPPIETWRLYNYFKDEAVFLDIETSSSTSMESYVTVIGLFDGYDTKIMVRDVNLDITALKKELKKYKLSITFNGAIFDVPYLNRKYPDLIPKIPHIDLRHLCNKVGLKGGLKQIEKELDIKRNLIVERFYGGDILKLWRMYKGSGDKHYLNLLVEYNEEDVINLKKITEYVVEKLYKNMKASFEL